MKPLRSAERLASVCVAAASRLADAKRAMGFTLLGDKKLPKL